MTAPNIKQPDPRPTAARSRRLRALEERLLVYAFARLHPLALGIALGTVTAASLFLATAVLLVRAAIWPPHDENVGPLLGLLSNYFPGYAVSWPGALVGLAYGFVLGFGLGVLVACIVNLNHHLYARRLNRSRARSNADR